jgi:predicted ribosomally synthesized peptide with SipW-like signal peptide
MKKRIALVALSIVLVFSLAIGGTLMLFTAESKVATNVVTTGTADILLKEWDVIEGKYVDVTEDKTFTLKGDTYGTLVDGDNIVKRPQVENTGDADVYLYVEVSILAPNGWSSDKIAAAFADSNITFNYTDDWHGITPVPTETGIKGGFFYVTERAGYLRALESGKTSSDVFESLTGAIDLPAELEGQDISIAVKAYGLQANNNDSLAKADKLSEWQTAFKNSFADLSYL